MWPFFTITSLLITAYLVLLLYYRQCWLNAPAFIRSQNFIPSVKISIIIPARNEAQNINACLSSIANQSYPVSLFEVIVVDDHSTDETAALVSIFPAQNIRLLLLKDLLADGQLNSYKKKAIEMAITSSTGELIITTDADCTVPPNWLLYIAAFYENQQPSFIVMPVSYQAGHNFFQIFQALDFMALQGITGAAVHKNFHSMCNGANLAYTKKAFMDAGGFTGIDDIASGDDMLLMHKIYLKHPKGIRFLKSGELIVQTKPMSSVKDFFNQRIRWASKAGKYGDKRITLVLLLVYFLNCWCLALGIASFFNIAIFYLFLVLLAGKTIMELFFLFPVAAFFRNQHLLWWFPLAQPFHIIYTVIAGWLGKFGSYQWKGRKVK